MRSLGVTVIAVALCSVQPASGQTVWPCAPAVSQAPAAPAASAYYSGDACVVSPSACRPIEVSPYCAVGGTTVRYAPYAVYRAPVPVSSTPSPYYVGRGMLGQPKLYVPGQPVRNFLRYLSP